jgi:hypothetical protein
MHQIRERGERYTSKKQRIREERQRPCCPATSGIPHGPERRSLVQRGKYILRVQVILLDIPCLPPTTIQKHTVHDREFGSLFWVTAPARRNRIPNGILQPMVLTCVRWTGWSFPEFDIGEHTSLITAIVWQNPCEDLTVRGRLYQVIEWSTAEERTSKEVIAME